jgi:hypothetical protein
MEPNTSAADAPSGQERADLIMAIDDEYMALAAEVANGDLNERLSAGTARADIVAVYRNLQEASQERHLPAFRRRAGRGSAPTGDGHRSQGRGRQRRRRGG